MMSIDTEQIPLISRGLYRFVSDVIGPECIVKLRREECDIDDELRNCVNSHSDIKITSGSTGEGFKMKTSDLDFMYVLKGSVVLPSHCLLPEGNLPQMNVLTYETDYSSPGFVMMKCLYFYESYREKSISNSLVWNSMGPYVSSKYFREYFLPLHAVFEINGPCVTAKHVYGEYDHAFCVKCPYWPREASSFITRSLGAEWPSHQMVTDICNEGCLFVPISNKQSHCQDTFDMEWRMSFSLAEKKLVHGMNHCQFLCYGLLKLFLNEVLKQNQAINGLLCSYFLKTAVFWEVSEDSSGWSIQNFLSKFWTTFCRLLKWVHVGYCPNFFNPGNNMFTGKICGHKQTLLMEVLRSFHDEGVLFLLKCPTLSMKLSTVFQLPILAGMISVDEEEYVSQSDIAGNEISCVMQAHNLALKDLFQCFEEIRYLTKVKSSSRLMNAALKFREKKTASQNCRRNICKDSAIRFR